MEQRQLGRSGLLVSALAFGTNTFGGRGKFAALGSTDLKSAQELIGICLDAGITLFDCADEYSDGEAERILGAALGTSRDRVILATKVRTATGPGPNDTGLSRRHLIKACEASLRRLGTDYIDLYQIHAWDGITPLHETLSTLDTLIRSGKVRYVGACNLSAWHLLKALGVSDQRGYERFVSHHIHYSLHARDAEYELIPAALDQGLALLVWSPLAGGLLAGKYLPGERPPSGSRWAQGWNEPPIFDDCELRKLVDLLIDLGDAYGISAAQVALAWLLGRPGVTSLVLGARTADQLRDNLGAAHFALSAQDSARLDTLTAPRLIYPYWHQAKIATDRLSGADAPLLSRYVQQND